MDAVPTTEENPEIGPMVQLFHGECPRIRRGTFVPQLCACAELDYDGDGVLSFADLREVSRLFAHTDCRRAHGMTAQRMVDATDEEINVSVRGAGAWPGCRSAPWMWQSIIHRIKSGEEGTGIS